ncbi:hypothetical protein ORM40_26365 [Bacillus cereus]|uniref:hypothetical protein n=1 Tax=Bacillus cereus TaxID=1396 RepID=UPI002AC0AD19|nr:hypothetical protein [Bacillus cereus]MDZ4508198.1 hypothetical protein [Bacillus cereus]
MAKNKHKIIEENRDIFLKRTSNMAHDLESVSSILVNFGLAKNRRIAQRWVRENRIKAEWLNAEDDRRAGKIVRESEIFKTITTEIPALKVMFNAIEELQKENDELKKQIEQSNKQK